ncbi:MAG: carboxymuconolactone decarboxylase family protein [Sphingomicrobium sp.]
MTATDDLTVQLEAIRAKRGYLLPHHGLMALTSPRLLAAYDATYTALTLEDRILDAHDKEFVWLAILISTDEALATHHIAKFRSASGTVDEIDSVLALAALALGVRAHRFIVDHWSVALPDIDPAGNFLAAQRRIAPAIAPRLIHLAMLAVLAAKAEWRVLHWQFVAAYADQVPEDEIAEALSLMMFPGSVPHFVEACGVWRHMILANEVAASPRYSAWAALVGQEGFDPARASSGNG